ncbi:MAG: hypothetical protein QNJ31_07365 [Candidatus Caenarcaniphilales bacterium]|nr:hypothetical protein [Candidatus Caenarcaniphilales bacterium]
MTRILPVIRVLHSPKRPGRHASRNNLIKNSEQYAQLSEDDKKMTLLNLTWKLDFGILNSNLQKRLTSKQKEQGELDEGSPKIDILKQEIKLINKAIGILQEIGKEAWNEFSLGKNK